MKKRRALNKRESYNSFLNGQFSELLRIDSGVPLGSVLGPLLFLVMINDFSSSVSCDTVLFTEDTTLYHTLRDRETLNQIITEAASESRIWFKNNGFLLNDNKTNYVVFSLSEIHTDVNTDVKLLGITLDSRLTWTSHTDAICQVIQSTIFATSL